MAKEVDPYGLRTIGVLTKPDTIEPNTHDRWLQIMLGHHFPLKLGYWMIKNPSKAEWDRMRSYPSLAFEEARKSEETFFATMVPWSGLKITMDRFGTDSLRREMGQQLAMLMEASLPDMKARTEESLHLVSMELSRIPPPLNLENPRIELLQMCRHFATVLNHHLAAEVGGGSSAGSVNSNGLNGGLEMKGFYQRVRMHFEAFRKGVYATRPVFALDRKPSGSTGSGSNSASGMGGIGPLPFMIAGTSMVPSVAASTSAGSGNGSTSQPQSTSSSITTSVSNAISSVLWSSSSDKKAGAAEKNVASNSSHSNVKDSSTASAPASSSNTDLETNNSEPNSTSASLAPLGSPARPLTLSDVRKIIESQKGRELQGHSPYGAFTYIVSAFQEEWGQLAATLLMNVSNEVNHLIIKLVEDVFGRFVNLSGQVK
jgi:hypothetical protein